MQSAKKLEKDLVLHMRWVGYYPRVGWPRYATKTIHDVGDQAALWIVLKQLWEWHLEIFPDDECPYDLDALP